MNPRKKSRKRVVKSVKKSRKRVVKSVKKSRKRVVKSVKKSRKRVVKSVKKSRKRVSRRKIIDNGAEYENKTELIEGIKKMLHQKFGDSFYDVGVGSDTFFIGDIKYQIFYGGGGVSIYTPGLPQISVENVVIEYSGRRVIVNDNKMTDLINAFVDSTGN